MHINNTQPFNVYEQWPDPDVTFLEPDKPTAPIMQNDDLEYIYGPWASWITEAANAKGCPIDYVALSLLTIAGACIGNACWAVPWADWKEPPVLWAMLVGDPSAGKSPALDAVLDPVKEIEKELSEAYLEAHRSWRDKDELASFALAQWKADAKKAIADSIETPEKPAEACAGKEPVRERIRIADATTEKVADLIATTWRGLLLCRDELSGWLGSMDRYNGGGDRPFWLEAFGGRPYTIDRKSNPEPVIVDHLSVSILGGTQPDKLQSLLIQCDDDGLLARFLVAYPDPVPLSRPTTRIDKDKLVTGLKRLRNLPVMKDSMGNNRPFYIQFTEDAANCFHTFRQQCREWEQDAHGPYKGHIGKLPGLVVRVSCILTHLDYAMDNNALTPSDIPLSCIQRAIRLVGDYTRLHAHRAYGTSKPATEITAAKSIAEVIKKDQLSSISIRDIQNRKRAGLKTSTEIQNAIKVLIDADWLQESRIETNGRPKIIYLVNPKIIILDETKR